MLGTLDEPADLGVRRHVRSCRMCRGETVALGEGLGTFARGAHEMPPPAELRERILGVLEQEWVPAASPVGRPARRPIRLLLARAAAVVILIASLGFAGVQAQRASHFRAQAAAYDSFLHTLGGSAVRVGRLRSAGTQEVQGSVVLYDSMVGQSWALVLVRAPGLSGEVRVSLSSGTHTIAMRSLYLTSSGEASSWLVTSADLRSFDHVMLSDATTGTVIATGITNR